MVILHETLALSCVAALAAGVAVAAAILLLGWGLRGAPGPRVAADRGRSSLIFFCFSRGRPGVVGGRGWAHPRKGNAHAARSFLGGRNEELLPGATTTGCPLRD